MRVGVGARVRVGVRVEARLGGGSHSAWCIERPTKAVRHLRRAEYRRVRACPRQKARRREWQRAAWKPLLA